MGVVQGDVGFDDAERQPERRPWWRRWNRRHAATAVGVVAVVGVTMCLTGIGTGEGPLGPAPGYGAAISRDVGDEITEGATVLVDDGWFAAHVESVRPLPVGEAATAVRVEAVELVPASRNGIGMVDGPGYDLLPSGVRSAPEGYVIHSARSFGSPGTAEVLVRFTVVQPGEWRFRGYEVVYRSGLVRHRMVADVDFRICTPRGAPCNPL